jgi:hypothetical protein
MRLPEVGNKDIPVLAEILREVGYEVEEISNSLVKRLIVAKDEASIMIEPGYGIFMCTEYMKGLPIFPFGHGSWHCRFEI